VSSDRPTALVIHDDGDSLDLLTRLFEASGFEVITALTGFRAQTYLEASRPIHVVVAPWDSTTSVGAEVYRWSLQQRYDLRDQFVFLAADVPPEFESDRRRSMPRDVDVAPGRGRTCRSCRGQTPPPARGRARRRVRNARQRIRPTLMLVEDERSCSP